MRLGIITDCTHYKNSDGLIGTENHIFLRQMEELSSHFTQTSMACPFAEIDATKVISWYNKDINFIKLPLAGGDGLKDKIKLLKTVPQWISSFRKIDKTSDVVYQRFPNNLNIPGFFYFWFNKKKVFATYTGTWGSFKDEPATYKMQRWFLEKLFRGPVWVYANKISANKRIISGFSPSYSKAEWEEETNNVSQKIAHIQEHGLQSLRLITVGTLISYKNQITILKACTILKRRNFPFTLKIVGYGPMFNELNTYIQKNDLENVVELTGKKKYQELRNLYRNADFVVQAPLKEGFGKVPVEGFFHGTIPVLNNISMAGYMTGNEDRGFLFEADDPQKLADKLVEIKSKVELLPEIIKNGRQFAKKQTLESWGNEYYAKVSEFYKF